MPYNIFVIGLDDLVEEQLGHIPHASLYNILPLLSPEEIARAPRFDISALMAKAERILESFSGSIDAIVTCWDFPSGLFAVCLREKFGLTSPALETVLRCEHKYWSRLIQAESLPGLIPDFQAVDPFADDPLTQIRLSYPFWLKPVKSHSSQLGFRIKNAQDFLRAIPIIRERIGRLGKPFDYFLDRADIPPEIKRINGHHCIAEAIISRGRQCTLEGYVQDGEIDIYGVVDSVRDSRHRSCFVRYEYPTSLPVNVRERMIEAGEKIIRAVKLENSPFNIEFYYDHTEDQIQLLEINVRISRSHTPLFQMVDGASHLKVMLDVALGRKAAPPHRRGAYAVAAKFMLRVFEDAVVEQAPGPAEIEAVRQRFPECLLEVHVKPGMRLSDMVQRDSYSYELAVLFLGAQNRRKLMQRYKECLRLLPFRFSTVETGLRANSL